MPGSIRTLLPRPGRGRRMLLHRPGSWWPTIAARQDDAFRNIWHGLRQHEHVEPPARWQQAWHERADSFIVCAVRVPATAEVPLAPVRQALATFPFTALAPPGSLYITIQELGLLVDTPKRHDETSLERVEEFSRQAALPISDYPAFRIELGGFNSFLDIPFLDVHDDGWCYRIHHRLRDFVLLPLDDSFAYLPHVPLGSYTRNAEMGDLPARMAPWRDSRLTSFDAETVDILRVSTQAPLATPEVIESFVLGRHIGATDAIREGNSPTDIF